MTIISTGAAPGPDPSASSTWRLVASPVFVTGPETRTFTLRRTARGWDLALHDYEARIGDGEVDAVAGFALAWSTPGEFWRWVGLIEDHDVDGVEIVALLRRQHDPALDRLADELLAARSAAPHR